MSTCCRSSDNPVAERRATLTIALAGNPNSGKTTLFNALTGLRQKVANYPGVTVERKTGRCNLPDGTTATLIDLPGAYSLISRSPDEVVAMEVLRGLRADTPMPDAVIVVVDASNLQRNLYLVSQLIELGRPLVVALNMMDVAENRGLRVSPQELQTQLGVPVIPVIGHKRIGVEELKAAVLQARSAPMPDWPIPQEYKEELLLVGGALAILDSQEPLPRNVAGVGFNPPPGEQSGNDLRSAAEADELRLSRFQAIAERLLVGDRAADLADIAQRQPVARLLESASARLTRLGIDPMQADIEAHYRWIETVAERATSAVAAREDSAAKPPRPFWSERLDSLLLHRFWGYFVFGAVMAALFVSIFVLADPIMSAAEGAVAWLGQGVAGSLPDGPLKDLLIDGIFAGVGAVVVFVPQIAVLFLFLAILEDSGYLARAAFLMDRLLARVGLHGKSFIPLLSSFACAIPGIMATRTIENRKDRLATILIAPFMSCSARLPVYILLIGTFFMHRPSWQRGAVMFGLYAAGVAIAGSVAWLFKRTLLRGPTPAFILELPSYKLPQISQVARGVWHNTSAFLYRAGTIIFFLSILMWALAYYPRLPQSAAAQYPDETALAAAQLDHSIAGRLGHAIEPVIRPLGYDWKIGVGLVGAFTARELFVSTIGIVYSVGDPGDDTTPLRSAMLADTYADGSPVWTPLVGVSLMIWFVVAMQCMSTLAVVRRETGTWGWPIFMLVYMNVLAYLICLAIYQVGIRWLA